jgi:hypothetical protein
MTQTLTGGVLRIVRKTNGLHGWGVIAGVGLAPTYIPNKDYAGPDTFTYTISDGHGNTATAAVSITVTTANQFR